MKKSLFIIAVVASLLMSANIWAQDNPVANIFFNPNVACVQNPVFFQDISTDPNGHTINTWLWDFGDLSTSTEQNPTHVFTAAGNYTISLTVWNDVGGSASTQIAINVFEVNVSFSPTNPQCFGEASGQVQAFAFGGSEPYNYSWNNGSTSSTINNLSAGVYILMVTDANGCGESASVSLFEPPQLIVNVTTTECLDSLGLGNVSAGVSGGTLPYLHIWDTGQIGSSLNGVTVGCYYITVSDSRNCTANAVGCLNGDLCVRNVEGRVYSDANSNCIIEDGEALQGVLVRAQPGPYYSYTNQDGLYYFYLDPGSYVIDVVNIDNYSVSCPVQGYQNINVVNIYDTIQNVNLGIEPAGYICPNLEVYLSSGPLRPCFTGTLYLNYKNTGTLAAEDVYIELLMDELLTYSSSTIPLSNSELNLLTFNLGTINPGQTGNFRVYADVQCDTELLGVTSCSEAVIFPNDPCLTDFGNWDHSSVSVEGYCQDNLNACFTITNTGDFGDGDMQNEHEFRIFANDTLVHIGNFQLLGQETIEICWPTEGRAIRLEADQHPEHPGNSQPRETMENCGDTNGSSLGYAVTVPQDDEDDFIDIYCRTLTGSYDPNDKLVQPTGITSNNYIDDNYTLHYQINFQNTGTDTAFTVVITDTISPVHDMSTFVNGGSSHPCELEITGQGILKWTFNNILLPDSTTNEPESNGFVAFSIKLHPMTEEDYGTQILNNAAIFFDFNPPIITNTTQLTFWELPITHFANIGNIKNDINISIYPNPAHDLIYIESDSNIKEYSVWDLTGKKIFAEKVNSNNFYFNVKGLNQGAYLIKIEDCKGMVSIKKLLIQK